MLHRSKIATIDLTLSDNDDNDSTSGLSELPSRNASRHSHPRNESPDSPQSVLQQFQPRKLPALPNSRGSVPSIPQHVPLLQQGGRAIRSAAQDPRRRFDAIASRSSRTSTPQRDNRGATSSLTSAMSPSYIVPKAHPTIKDAIKHPSTDAASPAGSSGAASTNGSGQAHTWKSESSSTRSERRGAPLETIGQTQEPHPQANGVASKASVGAMPIKEAHEFADDKSAFTRLVAPSSADNQPLKTGSPSLDSLERAAISMSSARTPFMPNGLKRNRDGSIKTNAPSATSTEHNSSTVDSDAAVVPAASDMGRIIDADTRPSANASTQLAYLTSSKATNEVVEAQADTQLSNSSDPQEQKVLDLARQYGNERTILYVQEMFSSLRDMPHEGKLRSGAWTSAEDRLIIHIRKELKQISWSTTGDFFPHRNSWHPMQSRYSTKLQHFIIDSFSHEVGGDVEPYKHSSAHLHSQPPLLRDTFNPYSAVRPQRSTRVSQPGVYRERKPSSIYSASPEPPPLSVTQVKTQEATDHTQPDLPPLGNHASALRDAPVSRRDLQCEVLPSLYRLNEERRRDLSASASLMLRIPGLRENNNVLRPYLSNTVRRYLARNHEIWDDTALAAWAGATIHTGMTKEEMSAIEAAASSVRKLAVTDSSMDMRERLMTLLTGVPMQQVQQIVRQVIWDGSCHGRSESAIGEYIYDVCDRQVEPEIKTAGMLSLGPSPSAYSRGQMLRGREMGLSSQKALRQELNTLGPAFQFKGTSADVNLVAWAPNADSFAVASFAVSDENSIAYNKPNNLLFGRVSDRRLMELPQHATCAVHTGPMSNMQDRLLFQTVSGLEFSPDGSFLVTGGYDKQARVWDISGARPEVMATIPHEQRIDVVSISSGGLFATGTQSGELPNDDRTGSTVRVLRLNRGEGILLAGRSYSLSSRLKHLEPACLRFGWAGEGRYLLGAFASSVPTSDKGVFTIWDTDVATISPLAQITSGNVFDAVWSPHTFGRIAVGSSKAPNASIGMQSVIRIYDSSRWSSTLDLDKYHSIELECPARDMNDVVFCSRDPYLVSTGCTDGKVYVWDIRNPKSLLHVCSHGKTLSEKEDNEIVDTGVRFISWGQAGRNLYSGSSDGVVMQWDPYRSPEDAYVRDVVRLESGVMSGAFSPDFTNLLLGDVAGNVSVLSVGNVDRGLDMRQAQEFEYEAAAKLKNEMRQEPEASNEGRSSARELLKSGKVELRPIGNLPKRQAVQGPAYVEPSANNRPPGCQPDDQFLRQQYYDFVVPKLRDAAALFQDNARLNEKTEPCKCTTNASWVTEEDFGDSGAWKARIPAELRKSQALRVEGMAAGAESSETASSPIQCFQCNRNQLIQSRIAAGRGELVDSDDIYACPGCKAEWRADILGYTCIRTARVSTTDKVTHRYVAPSPRSGSDEVGEEADEEESADESYYASLWGQ